MVDYNVNVLGGLNLGQAVGGAIDKYKQNQRQAQADQDNEKLRASMLGAAKGDPDAIESLYALKPQFAQMFENRQSQKMQQMGAAKAELSKQAETNWGMRYKAAKTPEEKEVLEQEALANDLIDFDESDLGFDSTQANTIVSAMLFDHMGKDAYREFYGSSGGGASIGTASPKDFTVESLSQYQQTGDIADLKRFSPKTLKVAGVEHQLNPETQRWESVIDATDKNLTTQAKAIADLEADKKSRTDFAKSKTKWKVGSLKFRSKISSAKDSHTILQATANQIKSHINGLTTKYGASLANIPGSEARTLARQLNTLKAHSAFSTLTDLKESGGTLGAISEAELVLLESKLGALDQGGDPAELVRVIDQIVNSNTSSIGRLEDEFRNTNAMYSGSFDDLDSAQNSPMSDADLLKKYGG